MPPSDRRPPDLTSDTGLIPKIITTPTSAKDPSWLHAIDVRETHWDWLDSVSPPQGVEVTEHAAPEGWIARTFGVKVTPDR